MQDVSEMQKNVMSISRSRVKMLFENPRSSILFCIKKGLMKFFIKNLDLTFQDKKEWILNINSDLHLYMCVCVCVCVKE